MRLEDFKYEGTITASQNDDFIGKMRQLRADAGMPVKFYAELSPAQQQAARSANGLSSMDMDEKQRYQACQLAHTMTYGNTLNYTPEDLHKSFTFTVIRERTTWGALEQRYDRTLLSDGWGINGGTDRKTSHTYLPDGPVSRTTEYEFLEFRWSGQFDHVTVIQLPTKNDLKR
jgi:hypothetical protein